MFYRGIKLTPPAYKIMAKTLIYLKTIFLLITSLLLASCGSSGGSASGSSEPSDTGQTDNIDRTEAVCEYQPKDTSCPVCDALPTFTPRDGNTLASAVNVADYGAVGDGTTRDHIAIQAAIDSAGVGGTIVFEGGKTYSICTKLTGEQDQLWTRSGNEPATIKRCDSPVSRLTQSAQIGDTTVYIDSTNGFEEGMWISPVKAGGNSFDDGEYGHHAVNSVSANSVTFYNGLDKNYNVGDKLVTSFAMVQDDKDNMTFEGLVFDGNRAGNDHFVSWARHSTLWLTAANSSVRYSSFINSQGDALTVQGSNNTIEFNTFKDLNGSAFHFSAASDIVVRQNNMYNTNEQFERVVHAEAAVTWSLGNQNIRVENNCIQNSGSRAFGKIAFHGNNQGAHITGNKVCNTSQLLWALTTEDKDVNLTFSNNTAVNAGMIDIYGLTDTSLSNIKIENNTLVNSLISLDQVKDTTVSGNHFELTSNSGLINNVTNSSNGLFDIIGSQDVDVSSNFIHGGTKGLFVRDSNDLTGNNISIKENSFSGQSHEAMTLGDIANLEAGYSARNNYVVEKNLICENQMESQTTAVHLPVGTEFRNNCVMSNQHAIAPFGQSAPTNLSALSLSENLIVSTGANFDVRNGLVHGINVSNNTLSEDIPSTLYNTGNVIQGNVVNPNQQCTLDNIAIPK